LSSFDLSLCDEEEEFDEDEVDDFDDVLAFEDSGDASDEDF
jgi:hypothetical protein